MCQNCINHVGHKKKDRKKKNKNHRKNLKLYVIRLGNDDQLMQSRPCDGCISWLKIFNVRKVIYTGDDGNIVETSVSNLETEEKHICSGKRHMQRVNDPNAVDLEEAPKYKPRKHYIGRRKAKYY